MDGDLRTRAARVARVAAHRAANKLAWLSARAAFARDVEALARAHGLPMVVDAVVGHDEPGVGVVTADAIPETVYTAIEEASENTGLRISAIIRLAPPEGSEN